MNLTVGPLPPAVYWRRRAIVLGGLLVVVLLLAYACSGPSTSTVADRQPGTTPTRVSVPSGSPSATPTVITSSPPPGPSPSGGVNFPTPTVGTSAPVGAPAPCADAEMQVNAVITSTSSATSKLQLGGTFDLKLEIKNISAHACTRDVGSVPEELRIMRGSTKIWSSDDCDTSKAKAHDVRTFDPGIQIFAELLWNSYDITTNNCKRSSTPAKAATYQLIGRLGSKVGTPTVFRIQ